MGFGSGVVVDGISLQNRGASFVIERGSAERPDATIHTDPGTLVALLWEGRRVAEAPRSGDVEIDGDRSAVERFLGLFPRPEQAAAPAAAA